MATVRYIYEGEIYIKGDPLKCELCRLVGEIQAPNVMTL